MLNSEVRQLEFLASIDDLRTRVSDWTNAETGWEPANRCRSLLKRILSRVETLRIRMEAPLVVATFGGTGVGKSSLVNALIGQELTRVGRERPTTTRPVAIAHADAGIEDLGLPLEEVDVVRHSSDLLRDVIILDCPDPDTSEGDTPGSNLDRLRTLLPYCDVLLHVSTQQKYRSARVVQELGTAARGCRILFVQTHADLDEDIREDWRATLSEEYEVPDIFFVDSPRALEEQRRGEVPSGEMGRLIELLRNKLGASDRVRIRRANVLDLLEAGLGRCVEIMHAHDEPLLELKNAMVAQRDQLSQRMAQRLETELLASHRLWERRLLAAVIDHWGMSPFSLLLRAYHGLGSILASSAFFRVRSSAQLAILGAMQGARWLEDKRKEQAAESTLHRLSHFGLDDSLLREAEIVIDGHVSAAGMSRAAKKDHSIDQLRKQAVAVEDHFVEDAGERIEEVIADLSRRNSRWYVRWIYELLFLIFVGFVLYRVGRNFFVDSFMYDLPLLPSDFYLAAGLFFLLWSAALIMFFTRRLQRGLSSRIRKMSSTMVEHRMERGLFPHIEDEVRKAERQRDELQALLVETTEMRHEFASTDVFGKRHQHATATLP